MHPTRVGKVFCVKADATVARPSTTPTAILLQRERYIYVSNINLIYGRYQIYSDKYWILSKNIEYSVRLYYDYEFISACDNYFWPVP